MITHHIVLFADRNAPSAPMEQAHAMTENITGHETFQTIKNKRSRQHHALPKHAVQTSTAACKASTLPVRSRACNSTFQTETAGGTHGTDI